MDALEAMGYSFDVFPHGISIKFQGENIGSVGTIGSTDGTPRNLLGNSELKSAAIRFAELHHQRIDHAKQTIIETPTYVLEADVQATKLGRVLSFYTTYPEARNDRTPHKVFSITLSRDELNALGDFLMGASLKVRSIPHDGRLIMGGKGSITPFNPSATVRPKKEQHPMQPAVDALEDFLNDHLKD